jgi:hypothetical protein
VAVPETICVYDTCRCVSEVCVCLTCTPPTVTAYLGSCVFVNAKVNANAKKRQHGEESSTPFKPHASPMLVVVISWTFEWRVGVQVCDVYKHVAVYK